MTTDIQQTASVQRLKGLLKHRYGKGLEVRYIVDTSISQMNAETSRVAGSDLMIPIQMHGMFLGLARIPSVLDLPSTSIQAITEVVRLILEPALYRRYLDGHLAESTVAGESGQIQLVREQTQETSARVSHLTILLSSNNPERINRAAINLHETTQRWALLRYSDMKNFGSAEEIKALGHATIFVEDLLQLSPAEIEILVEYLKTANAAHHPLILIGSTRKLKEIEDCGHYPPELITSLERFNAELDRWPTDERTLKQAFEMCLDEDANDC